MLVLEELEHARARGATILAEFVGGAVTCDAHHMTEPEPNGRGVITCIQLALERSGVAPEQVGDEISPSCAPGMPAWGGRGADGGLRGWLEFHKCIHWSVLHRTDIPSPPHMLPPTPHMRR